MNTILNASPEKTADSFSTLSGPAPWAVFTGAPSSGKTTTAELLEKMGYRIVPEVARLVIQQQLLLRPDTADQALELIVWQKKIEIELNLPRNLSFILDRALPDSIVYAELEHRDPEPYRAICARFRPYKRIFLFEPLPFSFDGVRTNEERLLVPRFHDRLGQVYTDLGYQVQLVPACSLSERIDFIRQELNRIGIRGTPQNDVSS